MELVIEYDKTSSTLLIDASASGGHVVIQCNSAQIQAESTITMDAPNTICTGNLTCR